MLTFRASCISGDIPLVVRAATSVESTAYSATSPAIASRVRPRQTGPGRVNTSARPWPPTATTMAVSTSTSDSTATATAVVPHDPLQPSGKRSKRTKCELVALAKKINRRAHLFSPPFSPPAPADCCNEGPPRPRPRPRSCFWWPVRPLPPREGGTTRPPRGGQARGRRAAFDTDDTTTCAGPPPTFREMK